GHAGPAAHLRATGGPDGADRGRGQEGRPGEGQAAVDRREGSVAAVPEGGVGRKGRDGVPGVIARHERTQLPGGPLVLTETIPGIRSVSAGVWVRSGSVHETRDEMGISHLLEHMVFKGTPSRSPREIALALERLGGSLDAYTTR